MSDDEERARSFRQAAAVHHRDLDDDGLKSLYADLFDRLKSPQSQDAPDLAAIDATMREIDQVHGALKARHARPEDTAQF